jgi:hypothetical protein
VKAELRRITKRFGDVVANRAIDLAVAETLADISRRYPDASPYSHGSDSVQAIALLASSPNRRSRDEHSER